MSPTGELLTWERVSGLQRQVDRMEGKLDAALEMRNAVAEHDERIKALELAAAGAAALHMSRSKLMDTIIAVLLAIIGSGVWISFVIKGP